MKEILLGIVLSLAFANVALANVPKNSVGTKQLKSNAVKGNKVKNDTITDVDISEVTNIAFKSLSNGQSQSIYSDGVVTLQARCAINEGGTTDFARVLVFSTLEGTALDGNDVQENLLVSTLDADREISLDSAPTTTLSFDQENDGTILLPNGTSYIVKLGLGINLYGSIGTCTFSGRVYRVPNV